VAPGSPDPGPHCPLSRSHSRSASAWTRPLRRVAVCNSPIRSSDLIVIEDNVVNASFI